MSLSALKNHLEIVNLLLSDKRISVHSYCFAECSSLGRITIPYSVSSIEDHAFYKCTFLERITIPPSVKYIGRSCFYDCSFLLEISISPSITSIEDHTFYRCSHLKEVIIPPSVSSIGDHAFYGCSFLHKVIIPPSVTIIRNSAFMGCISLEEIIIPDSVTFIGEFAFASCWLLHKITMPSLITSLGRGIFCGCKSLTTMTYNCLENYVKYKYPIPFLMPNDDSLFNSSEYVSLTSIDLPNVQVFGSQAFDPFHSFGFDNCHIIIPPNVEIIDSIAFSGCQNITHIEIPSSLILIKNDSILKCISLRMMIVPPTLNHLKMQFPNIHIYTKKDYSI